MDPSGETPVEILEQLEKEQQVWIDKMSNSTPSFCNSNQQSCSTINPFALFDYLPITGDISDAYSLHTGKTLFGQTQLTPDQLNNIGAFAMLPIFTAGQARAVGEGIELVDKALVKGARNMSIGKPVTSLFSESKINNFLPTQDYLNPKKVEEYYDIIKSGGKVRPIEVVEGFGGKKYITEGHHRYIAGQKAGVEVPYVIVGKGNLGGTTWKNVMFEIEQ